MKNLRKLIGYPFKLFAMLLLYLGLVLLSLHALILGVDNFKRLVGVIDKLFDASRQLKCEQSSGGPRYGIPELTDERLKQCLGFLTEIQYFGGCSHKHRDWAWDAIRALAPEIAELSSNDPKAAYELFHEQ